MKTLLLIFFLVPIFLFAEESSLSKTEKYFQKPRHALVIGVNQYADKSIPALNYAVRDSLKVKKTFELIGHFSKIEIINDDTTIKPNKKEIEDAILRLAEKVNRDGKEVSVDTLVVYFSGHGFSNKEKEDSEIKDYIIPLDASNEKKKDTLIESSISVIQYKEKLKAMGVKRIIFLIDACRTRLVPAPNTTAIAVNTDLTVANTNPKSVSQTKNLSKIENVEKDVETEFQEKYGIKKHEEISEILSNNIIDSKGFVVLFGSADGEETNEKKEFKGGVFTYYLCLGLLKDIPNRAGPEYVSYRSLESYLDNTFKQHNKEYDANQKLYKTSDFTGDLLLTYGRPSDQATIRRFKYQDVNQIEVYGKWIINSEKKREQVVYYTRSIENNQYIARDLDGIGSMKMVHSEKNDAPYLESNQYLPDGKNIFTHKIEYLDEKGWQVRYLYSPEEKEEDVEQKKKANVKFRKRELDFNGNVTMEEFYDRTGKLLEIDKITRTIFAWDIYGNLTKREFYYCETTETKSEQNGQTRMSDLPIVSNLPCKLTNDKNGVAKYIAAYQAKDKPILEENYDAEGNLTNDKNTKIARVAYLYDANGHLLVKENFGVPKELKDKNVKTRFSQLELVEDYKRVHRYVYERNEQGILLKETHYNSKNEVAPDTEGKAISVYEYNAGGNKVKESHYRTENELWQKGGISHIQYEYDANGRKISEKYYTTYYLKDNTEIHPTTNDEGVHEYRYAYYEHNINQKAKSELERLKKKGIEIKNEQEFLKEKANEIHGQYLESISLYDKTGKPYQNAKGVHRTEFDYNYWDQKLESELYFDKLGILVGLDYFKRNPKADSYTRYKYDEKGNRILEETYGADGQLEGSRFSRIARTVRKYDENCLKLQFYTFCLELEETYGENGKLIGDYYGIARTVYKYDENCLKLKGIRVCLKLEETYGADEKLIGKNNGIARTVYKYDEIGNRILIETYGADEKLIGSNTGIARTVWKHDEKGNQVLFERYDVDGKLIGDYYGIARTVYKYDDNCLKFGKNEYQDCKTLEETYGVIGNKATKIARKVRKYDEKGNKIFEEHYGADEKLKDDGYGIARYVWKYDEKGKKIFEEHYGSDEKLKGDGYGIARYVWEYDEKGNKVFEEYEVAGGQLMSHKFYGIARFVWKYDEKGNKVLEEYYGADKKLNGGIKGIAQYIYKYDANCLKYKKYYDNCITLAETYGTDGLLKDDSYGVAKTVYKYDANCLKYRKNYDNCITLAETYGTDGLLKDDSDGIARTIQNYDEKGNLILKEYYGADQQLKGDRYGYGIGRTEYKYDEYGNNILEEYYGMDRQLYIYGIARNVYKHNEYGNQVFQASYNAKGELLSKNGKEVHREYLKESNDKNVSFRLPVSAETIEDDGFMSLKDNLYHAYFKNPKGNHDKRLLHIKLDRYYRPIGYEFLLLAPFDEEKTPTKE